VSTKPAAAQKAVVRIKLYVVAVLHYGRLKKLP
jgi:hypothetical protein